MNTLKMQKNFYSHTYGRYKIVAPNIFLGSNEHDIFCIRKSGYADEIEIKISVADFNKDFEKTYYKHGRINKHEAIQRGLMPACYFSFFLPETIADKCDIPDYAGLYVAYIDNAGHMRVTEKKRAPRLHKNKISDKLEYKILHKMYFKYWAGQEN